MTFLYQKWVSRQPNTYGTRTSRMQKTVAMTASNIARGKRKKVWLAPLITEGMEGNFIYFWLKLTIMKKLFCLLVLPVFFLLTSFTHPTISWVAIGDSITYLNDHPYETS